MKAIRAILLLFVLAVLVSCGSVGLASKVHKTSVGMTKEQVLNKLGKSYEIIHSMLTPEGDVVEILLFTDGLQGTRYEYEFYNDTLVRYTKVKSLQAADPDKKHSHEHRH